MSVWTTKSNNKNSDYVLIKHFLPGINYRINGIKFRGGFAVVEKGSKSYHFLKKLPQLTNAVEYNLLHLKKLPFITKTSDIRTVYGEDVYRKYMTLLEYSETQEYKEQQKEVEKQIQEEEEIHLSEESIKCHYRLSNGNLCKNDSEKLSPSKHCIIHLLEDPKLADFGISIPLAIPKHMRKDLKKKVLNKLKKLLKEVTDGEIEV
jgi:hypothetical protein